MSAWNPLFFCVCCYVCFDCFIYKYIYVLRGKTIYFVPFFVLFIRKGEKREKVVKILYLCILYIDTLCLYTKSNLLLYIIYVFRIDLFDRERERIY